MLLTSDVIAVCPLFIFNSKT